MFQPSRHQPSRTRAPGHSGRLLRRQLRNAHMGIACLTIVLCAASSIAADHAAPVVPPAAAIPAPESAQKVAALASPATVGIYCQKDGDRFYGTGVTIDGAGYLLTSTTVVPEGATMIEVYFSDHTRLEAKIIEMSPPVEAVLLKVEAPKPLPFLPLAGDLPTVGEPAYTLGNSGNMIKLGDGASFSAGVVSGLYEVKSIDSMSGYSGQGIETDAAVNDGQDGGPLLDATGRVIGILSRSFSPARWQGVAVPTKNILAYMKSFTGGTPPLHLQPALDAKAGDSFPAAAEAARALVALEVQRLFPPEEVRRQDWTAYRNKVPNWATLTEDEKNRVVADFFAADNLLAANQMIRRPAANATGVLISADGYILTSAFNVQSSDLVYIPKDLPKPELPEYAGNIAKLYGLKADDYRKVTNRVTRIMAVLPGGATVPAEIVGFDLSLGVALLKATGGNLPHLNLEALSAEPATGEAIALLGVMSGRPGYTVNTGIVSATGRNNGALLQFDALLNYGNSGGPLISSSGKFLGLATNPLSPAPVMGKLLPYQTPADDPGARALADFSNCPNSGVGMAAAAEKIRESLPTMREGEGIERSTNINLGFLPTTDSAFAAKVIVGRVTENSPAAKAELKSGDEIVALDGVGVRSWREIQKYVKEKQAGEVIVFEVFRPLGKPYLFLNGKKLESAADFGKFMEESADNQAVSGNVYRPGVKQQIYLRLGKEK